MSVDNKQVVLTDHKEFFIVHPLSDNESQQIPDDDLEKCLSVKPHIKFVLNFPTIEINDAPETTQTACTVQI
ncbi:hypothetical protein [Epiphyas postvittana nucleopolyhedrovirus]|uniref:Uncharacterized protein n=1 Tax=Epiphyas postvittana nucleopolyhedrovirus TaxID=70600 RepID=Q91GC1_NPVEP|nr:hypothetical protein [Epiphyas postvittana nucleopolyhedrovirus]AAK85698.1 unknown [Epiphyas postvittana nucleopolyhedrovirus]